MKKIYTQHTLNEFFEEFKNLSNSYKIEQVHQLLNNPDAKATHKVKFHFKHLKLIIMTSAFIMGISAILLWLSPKETVKVDFSTEKHPIQIEYATNVAKEPKQINSQDSKHLANKDVTPGQKVIEDDIISINSDENVINTKSLNAKNNIYDSIAEEKCSWPLDTVIDKRSLYVYLTKPELEKLGVILKKKSMYYENSTPDGKIGTGNKYNWNGKTDMKTFHEFYMAYDSDTACTKYRWGHRFYSKIDTLVPVYIELNSEPKILWFTPHASLFKALPKRYASLENTYKNLKCVKPQNPSHQFVNHWNKEQNIVLDEINYLSVSNETLEKIGFELFTDSISLVHPDFNMQYNMGKWRNLIGSYTRNTPYPPNPLPVIVTDEKGLTQNYFGHGATTDFANSMFDILVPVKIPLNELISTKDYYLIFWFYPTDEFINALPEDIKYDLKSERNEILKSTANSTNSCRYFEVCKSTLRIDGLKVYPNPARTNLTIEFSLPNETSGKISLVNISGVQIKTLVSQNNFLSGLNSFEVNLSDVSPGVYLVSITTPNGFRTQRIIVSR